MFFRILLDVCVPIFGIVAAGWLMDRKFKLHLETLVKLNIYLMVPAFIFTRMVSAELGGGEALRIAAFTLATIALMFAGSLLAGRIFRMPRLERQALSLAAMFYNCGNYGLPLVTLGVQMSQTTPAPFRAPLWSAILLRLVISPALAVLLVLAFGFSREVSAALILAAAAPTAVNTALLAHEFGGDVSFSTSAVCYSTLFSLITTPALVYALKLWL